MRAIHALTCTAWLAALGFVACAPASDIEALGGRETVGPGELEGPEGPPGAIDVTAASPISLALRGGLGPIIEGQTISQAVVSLQSIELVGEGGNVVPLLDQPTTVDLLSIQNDLDELVSRVPLPPGRFTHLRCRLGGAFIEASAEQGEGVQFFATPGMDLSAYEIPGPVGTLGLGGIEPGGYFDVALPPGGIAISGPMSLAMQFDLAQSLAFEGGAWTLSPRMWAIDQAAFSSIDVVFEAQQAAGFAEVATEGFQVMLFDSGMAPVSYAPLTMIGGVPGASFQYLAPFQGPFVAVLVPPPGIQLASVVSTSVSVATSVHVQTSIVINSFQEVRRVGGVPVFAIGAADQARIVQRGPAGAIIQRGFAPVGPIQAIAPRVRPRVPLLPGQAPPRVFPRVPYLRGLPRPEGIGPGVRPGGPPIHRPGERPGVPGQRPPGVRPPGGERPGIPGQRPPGVRPPGGERPGVPGQRGPGAPQRMIDVREPAPTPRSNQAERGPRERPPLTNPYTTENRPERPPAELHLPAPPAAPEARPRVSPRRPDARRPEARRPTVREQRPNKPSKLTADEE